MSLKSPLILTVLLALFSAPDFAQAKIERIYECTEEFNSSEWKITLSADLTRGLFFDGRYETKFRLRTLRTYGKKQEMNDYIFESFNRRSPLVRFFFQSKQKTGWLTDYVGTPAERRFPFRCKKIDVEVGTLK